MPENEIIAWNLESEPGVFTRYVCYDDTKLPLAGGTMTGTIKMAAAGMETNQDSGYVTDAEGNLKHARSNTGDTWDIKNNAGTVMFSINYETGAIVKGIWQGDSLNLSFTDIDGELPASRITGLGDLAFENAPLDVTKGGTSVTSYAALRVVMNVPENTNFTTFSGTSLSAATNTEYANGTAIGSLAITLPTAARGVIFGVNFTSASTFSGVTFSSTVKVKGDKLNKAGMRYNLIVWYDGSHWICASMAV